MYIHTHLCTYDIRHAQPAALHIHVDTNNERMIGPSVWPVWLFFQLPPCRIRSRKTSGASNGGYPDEALSTWTTGQTEPALEEKPAVDGPHDELLHKAPVPVSLSRSTNIHATRKA